MANVLKFESIDNARQLGGIPAGGSHVKHNLLFRSSNLSKATEHDLHRLRDDFGVHLVIDLRSDFEYMQKPDKLLDGMESVLIPVLDDSMPVMRLTRTRWCLRRAWTLWSSFLVLPAIRLLDC